MSSAAEAQPEDLNGGCLQPNLIHFRPQAPELPIAGHNVRAMLFGQCGGVGHRIQDRRMRLLRGHRSRSVFFSSARAFRRLWSRYLPKWVRMDGRAPGGVGAALLVRTVCVFRFIGWQNLAPSDSNVEMQGGRAADCFCQGWGGAVFLSV